MIIHELRKESAELESKIQTLVNEFIEKNGACKIVIECKNIQERIALGQTYIGNIIQVSIIA